MKRYLLEGVGEQGGEPAYVMRENLMGEWIRRDDADLAALVAAAQSAATSLGEIRLNAACAMTAEFTRQWLDEIASQAVRTAARLNTAIAAVAGTTTRGGET